MHGIAQNNCSCLPYLLQVYIVRADALTETDLAINLVNLGACVKEMVDGKVVY